MRENQPSPYRAFIIDKSDLSRKQISTILKELNITIVGETDSMVEAVSLIPKLEANIVILDYVMPDLNGVELLKKFHKQLGEIFFVVVSALSTQHAVFQAISSGAIDYIAKPLDRNIFIQSILRVKQKVHQSNLVVAGE